MKEVKKKVADRIGRIIILKVEMSGKNGPRDYRTDEFGLFSELRL